MQDLRGVTYTAMVTDLTEDSEQVWRLPDKTIPEGESYHVVAQAAAAPKGQAAVFGGDSSTAAGMFMAAASGVGSRIWDRDMEQFAAVLAEEVGEEKGDRVFLRQTAHSLSRGMQAADVAAGKVNKATRARQWGKFEGGWRILVAGQAGTGRESKEPWTRRGQRGTGLPRSAHGPRV